MQANRLRKRQLRHQVGPGKSRPCVRLSIVATLEGGQLGSVSGTVRSDIFYPGLD